MKNYNEFCKEQADKLLEIIDQHEGLLKWQKTWQMRGCPSLPKSVNGFYRGVNLWKLLVEQISGGLGSDTWLTFNQVKQNGGYVLKGAKGKRVCYFKLKELEVGEGGDDSKQDAVPLFRLYTVFNLDQTSLAEQGGSTVSHPPEMFQKLLNTLKVNLSEFGNQPRFQPLDDVIVMPRREFFNSPQDYDVTLMHELIHWTGHLSRLNRETCKDYGKSDAARAEEELVAEIGSVFLASYFGIAGDLVNHASYIASWKKCLTSKAVGRAISHAARAFNWLVSQIEVQREEAA